MMKSLLSVLYLIGLIWTVAVLFSEVHGRDKFNLLLKDCGPKTADRISLGNKTFVFDYPWMAVIRYMEMDKIVDRCAGSLINERYVLTAAHCIRSKRLHSVILGEHTKNEDPDCNKYRSNYWDCADAVEEYGIESFEYHHKYNNPKYSNDIGLLRLNRSVIMKDHIQPICLPVTPELQSITFSKYIVTGWGTTKNSTSSDVLLEADLPRVGNEDCQEILDRLRLNIQIGSKQMCAGGENMVDTCSGDSGGPLGYYANYGQITRFVQFGIVSTGINSCGQKNAPGVYCLVAGYMDWILDKMQPSF